MSDYHINNTGSVTAPYDTWAKAANSIVTPSQGDNKQFLLDNTYTITYSSTTTFTFRYNEYYANYIISGIPDTISGLASAAAGATIATTNDASLIIKGSVYTEGVTFDLNVGGSPYYGGSFRGVSATASYSSHQVYKNCTVKLSDSISSSRVQLGESYVTSAMVSKFELIECEFYFSHESQGLILYNGEFLFEGLSFASGTSAFTRLIVQIGYNSTSSCKAVFSGCDFSLASASLGLVWNAYGRVEIIFRNCKLPASWGGTIASFISTELCRISLYNCSSGATVYPSIITTLRGTITADTTVVRTNGAYDGTTQISWKFSASSTRYPLVSLDSDPIIVWNSITGSAITITVEIVSDTATALTDADIYMDVEYLGDASHLIGTAVTTRPASFISAASDLASSSASWTTTGLTTPLKQKLSLSFTPQQAGFISAKIKLAKNTAVVYVCPKLDVT